MLFNKKLTVSAATKIADNIGSVTYSYESVFDIGAKFTSFKGEEGQTINGVTTFVNTFTALIRTTSNSRTITVDEHIITYNDRDYMITLINRETAERGLTEIQCRGFVNNVSD